MNRIVHSNVVIVAASRASRYRHSNRIEHWYSNKQLGSNRFIPKMIGGQTKAVGPRPLPPLCYVRQRGYFMRKQKQKKVFFFLNF